jgi:hypothetical protein
MKVEETIMTSIKINEKNRTIELTKAFSNKANKYGTVEYRELQEVRRDYPSFKVVTKNTVKNKDGLKGLTLEYMEKYIKDHKDGKIKNEETGEETTMDLLVEFYDMCGKDENGKKTEFSKVAPYGKIKKWFLKTYPIFEEYKQNNLKKCS